MVVKTYPNPRVLIVKPHGDIEFYRPRDRDVEVNGDFEYADQDEMHTMYGGKIAVVLKNFKGEIGVPKGVPVKVERYYNCNRISGTLSGSCSIECAGFADLIVPKGIELIARGKDIIISGKNTIPDDNNPENSKWWVSGKDELMLAMRKRPDYKIEAPRKIDVDGQIRMVKSLGCLPLWIPDEIVLAEMHNVVYVDAEKVSIAEYEDDVPEEKTEGGLEMSLYSYMLGCAQGLSFDDPKDIADKSDAESETEKPKIGSETSKSDTEIFLESVNDVLQESGKYTEAPKQEAVDHVEKLDEAEPIPTQEDLPIPVWKKLMKGLRESLWKY